MRVLYTSFGSMRRLFDNVGGGCRKVTGSHVARVSPLLRGQVTGHGVYVIVPPTHLTGCCRKLFCALWVIIRMAICITLWIICSSISVVGRTSLYTESRRGRGLDYMCRPCVATWTLEYADEAGREVPLKYNPCLHYSGGGGGWRAGVEGGSVGMNFRLINYLPLFSNTVQLMGNWGGWWLWQGGSSFNVAD